MPYHFKYFNAPFTIVALSSRGWPICDFHQGLLLKDIRPQDLYAENDPAEIVRAMAEAPAAELVPDY